MVTTRLLRLRSSFLFSREQVIVGVLVAIGFASLMALSYGWAAGSGLLGDKEATRFAKQSGELGVLFGGRTSLVGSVLAISDTPIVGHGSRQRDKEYSDRTRDFLQAQGYDVAFLDLDPEAILTHGALLGTWVAAGFLGVVFWLVVLRVLFRALLVTHKLPLMWQPLVVFTALQLLWDTGVSPFAGFSKIAVPASLVFLIAVTDTVTRTSARPTTGRRQR